MIVLLGEVGGVEEYKIVEALKAKKITKPLVAWCIGTCADHITSEVGNSSIFSVILRRSSLFTTCKYL